MGYKLKKKYQLCKVQNKLHKTANLEATDILWQLLNTI